MPVFRRNGTSESGYAALPSSKEIFDGKGPGAIEIKVSEKIGTVDNPIYKGLKWLGDHFGWVASYEAPRERKPKPPPKPEPKEGGYSREGYVDPRISAFARENVLSDFYRTGVDLELLPEYQMKTRFGDPDGYQMGRNVWANPDIADFPEVAFHEGASALLEELTGRNHYELHDVVRPLERVAGAEYRMGMPNVLERNVRRAMRSLRN